MKLLGAEATDDFRKLEESIAALPGHIPASSEGGMFDWLDESLWREGYQTDFKCHFAKVLHNLQNRPDATKTLTRTVVITVPVSMAP